MTEPDEAKQYAQSRIHGAGRAAWMAVPIKDELAMAYRAGQAASAERIKAVEEAIDAARLNGIRLGLEAAAREANKWQMQIRPCDRFVDDAIRALDPETIAKEAAPPARKDHRADAAADAFYVEEADQ